MDNSAKIFIEGGPPEWRRSSTNQTFLLTSVSMYCRVGKLTYQRSLGDSEGSRFFGSATLDRDLCAFGHPDTNTRELSLEIRGSTEETITRLKNARVIGQVTEAEMNQEIERLKQLGLGAALSYYPPNSELGTPLWSLEIILRKQEFDNIIDSYRNRRLSGMLLRITSPLLIQQQPNFGLTYLCWNNERQCNKSPPLTLDFLSWLEPELQLAEWPFS